jgi:hypothetical protein
MHLKRTGSINPLTAREDKAGVQVSKGKGSREEATCDYTTTSRYRESSLK